MNRFTRTILTLTLCLATAALFAPAGSAFVTPWQVGESWTLKAVYRSVRGEAKWSDPVFWIYRVAAVEDLEDTACWRVDASRRSDPDVIVSQFWFKMEDRSLVLARLLKKRRGTIEEKKVAYKDGRPVKTGQTLTPHDWPAAPLSVDSKRSFSRRRKLDDELTVNDTRVQTVRRVDPEKEIAGMPAGPDMLEVICQGRGGRVLFRIYFKNDFPWPVHGENPSMRYWLVEP
jgi:hypothetical protein